MHDISSDKKEMESMCKMMMEMHSKMQAMMSKMGGGKLKEKMSNMKPEHKEEY